jgi:hypothetical protein
MAKGPLAPRKPLRRTAWAMLICGLALTAAQLSVGVLAVSQGGTPAGPGQEATWPAGQTMVLDRTPGELNTEAARTARCLVTENGKQRRETLAVGDPTEPLSPGDVTLTCDQPLTLLTGTPMTIAEYARGPLICIPLLLTFLGILFFFPRFTFFWARSRVGDTMMRAAKLPPFD